MRFLIAELQRQRRASGIDDRASSMPRNFRFLGKKPILSVADATSDDWSPENCIWFDEGILLSPAVSLLVQGSGGA